MPAPRVGRGPTLVLRILSSSLPLSLPPTRLPRHEPPILPPLPCLKDVYGAHQRDMSEARSCLSPPGPSPPTALRSLPRLWAAGMVPTTRNGSAWPRVVPPTSGP